MRISGWSSDGCSSGLGRILLAIDLARLQRLAGRWDVSVEVVPSIGEFVAQNAPLFEVPGPSLKVRPTTLMTCLIFGDTPSPAVSPGAALQSLRKSFLAGKRVSVRLDFGGTRFI